MASFFHPRLSLKARISFATLSILLASSWTLMFFASQVLRKDMERQLGEQQFATVSLVAAHINNELEDRLNALKKVAGLTENSIPNGLVTMQSVLEQSQLLQTLFNSGIVCQGIDGSVIADFPLTLARRNYAKIAEAFTATLGEGKSSISQPLLDELAMNPTISMTVPMHDAQGNVIAALSGVTSLDTRNFLDRITESHYGKTGGYLLVSPQYRLVVTATDKSRVMETLPAPGINPLIDRFMAGFEGSGVVVNPLGVEVLASAKSIPIAGWYVVALLPTAEAFTPIRDMQQRMLLTTIILTLVAAGLIGWILNRQLSPLLVTAKTLAAMSDARQPLSSLPVVELDEIGRLISGFNRLLNVLGQREKDLQESEHLLMQSQSLAGIGSYILDVTTGQWKSSAVFDKTFGIDESYDRSVSGWGAMVHPDDRSMMIDYFTNEVVGQGQAFDKIYRIIRQNDQVVRWAHGLGKLEFDGDGRPFRMLGTIQDITERRMAEEALRESEESLSTTLNSIGDAVIATDMNGHVTRMNPTAERLTGWRLEDALDRPLPEVFCIINTDKRDAEITPDLAALDQGQLSNFANHRLLLARDGKEYRISDSAASIRNALGQAVGVVRVFSDVTERYRMETVIQQEQQFSKLILDSLPGIFYLYTYPENRLILWNKQHESLLGYEAGEMQGRLVTDWFLPEAKEAALKSIDEVMTTGQNSMEAPLVAKDGHLVYFALTGVKFKVKNQSHFMGIGVDITELKRAESALQDSELKLEAIFNASPAAMSVSDADNDFRIINVNMAWERQFRRQRRSISGLNGSELGLWADPSDRDQFLAVLNNSNAIEELETELLTGDGQRIFCNISAHITEIHGNRLLLMMTVDITERRRIENEILQLNAELEDRVAKRTEELSGANTKLAASLNNLRRTQDELLRKEKLSSLGALVAGVAHELNTPIGNAVTVASTLVDLQRKFSEQVKSGLSRSSLVTFVDTVGEAGQILDRNLYRAAELVGSFKQLAVDQSSYQRRHFELKEVVNEIVLAMGPAIRKTPYRLLVEVQPSLHLDSYPGPLGQILMNLINNALIHAFENSEAGSIHIKALAVEPEWIKLSVRDDGRGISAEHQKRIFDPFFTTRLGQGGSGLGLHIVFNLIVDVLGGQVDVTSAMGEGTKFTVRVPVIAPLPKGLASSGDRQNNLTSTVS